MLIYLLAFAILALAFATYFLLLRRKPTGPQKRIYHGYVQYLDDDGEWQYEHRRVAEEKVGGQIHKGRVVHHIDGNRQNNDPKNLRVMPASKHKRMHKRIRWAKKHKRRGEE